MNEQHKYSKETEVAILKGIFKELTKQGIITTDELEDLIIELEGIDKYEESGSILQGFDR